MTNMVVVISAEFPQPIEFRTSDGISLSFTTSSFDPTCSERFCILNVNYTGVVVTVMPEEHLVRSTYYFDSGNFSYENCDNEEEFPCSYLAVNETLYNEKFTLVVSIMSGNILTTQICNETMGDCQMTGFRTDLGFKMANLDEPPTYAISTNNEATSNRSATLINSVDFYAAVSCQPECVNGKCIGDNQCFCIAGWTGPICDQRKLSSCLFSFLSLQPGLCFSNMYEPLSKWRNMCTS